MSSIGIDIGASHIACGLYNSEYDKLECKIYLPNFMDKTIDINVSTKLFINIVINLIDKLIKNNYILIDKVTSIGIGCPGGIDKKSGIFFGSSSLNLKEINWRNELEKYHTEIFVENDCTCVGICESYCNNMNDFLMLTLGSSLGIAYMHNYECINQITWSIMELNRKIENEQEGYIKSFEALSNKYNTGKKGKFKRWDIFKSMESGDLEAKRILKDYLEDFIQGIIKIHETHNIKNFCIGGGMSEHSKYFIDEIRRCLPDFNFSIAKYKNDSGIIGAALLKRINNL